MTKREPIVNVRMDPTRIEQLDEHAGKDGLRRSTWAREILLMVLDAGLTLEQVRSMTATKPPVQTVLSSARLGARIVLTGRCLHPVHLRTPYPTFDKCECGQVFHR